VTGSEDPTDLRRALAEAQQRLQALVDMGGALGTVEFELADDGELVFVRADEEAGRLMTVANPRYYGKRLPEVITGTAGTDLHAVLREAARTGKPMPSRTLVPPGVRMGRALSMFAFQSAPGRVAVKFWENTAPDAVREIGRRNEELVAQIFERSPVAMVLSREPEGTIADVNAAWSQLTGHQRHEVLGRATIEPPIWPSPEARERTLAPLHQQGLLYCPEVPLKARDGRDLVVSLFGSRVNIGGVSHRLLYLLDITARTQAEDALRRLNAELEQRVAERTGELAAARDAAERASRVKSEFLSGMSHELRTPLNAILGFGQLLQSDAAQPLPSRQRGFVKEILRAGEHLLELINEVLDLARVEAGKLQISLEPVHLASLVADCVALVRPVAQEHRIELIVPAPADCERHVSADRTRAKQVLLNLLSNAIKYNREGGQVRVSCQADGDGVRLDVTDSGPGLSREQQERLFQDYERLDADRSSTPGTGIGLALSRRLMELMQGQIGVRSEPGAGSTFWVRFASAEPISGITTGAAATDSARGMPEPPPAAQAEQRCVLYIEDNPANVHLMEAVLRLRADVHMVHAPLPSLGLELARSERPRLILLDIQLPGMDGYEVLRRLRMSEATRSIPVVAISANAMPADVSRGLAAGFAHYLTKPLDVARLLSVVDEMLGG